MSRLGWGSELGHIKFQRHVKAAPLSQSSPPPEYVGPLDLAPGAVVAWGLRALSASMLGENVVRLRRDSDDAELDFAADAVTGEIDAAVQAWLLVSYEASTAAIVSGGGGYPANEQFYLEVVGGTAEEPAYLLVNSDENGVVVSFDSFDGPGEYSVVPSNPVETLADQGSGCTVNLTWTPTYANAYIVKAYDQIGDNDVSADYMVGVFNNQPLYVSSFKGGKPGMTGHNAESKPLNLQPPTTNPSFPDGKVSVIGLISTGGAGDGDGVRLSSNNGGPAGTSNAGTATTLAIEIYDPDFDAAGGAHYDTPSAAGVVFDAGWEQGTKTMYVDGVSLAFDEDYDFGSALDPLTIDDAIKINIRSGVSEIMVYNTLKSPAVREPARENIADFYGITLS